MTDWYRERPFKVAFAISVVIHAVLIAFIPGFRSVPIETPRVLDVEIVPMQAPPAPRILEKPVVPPKTVEPKVESIPEPVVRQPPPELIPEPVVRQPQPDPVVRQPPPAPIPEPVLRQSQPEPPPVPRAEIIRAPRAEPMAEFVVPKPELRPEPKAEPRLETRPVPKIEPRPEPPPVARIEPRVEPSVVAPSVARPGPAPVTVQPAPVVAPQPKVADESRERTLMEQYQQTISARIKKFEEYPPVAKRRHWEGTTVVQLRLTAEGKVTDIAVVEKSGYEILDEAAVKMIRRASPLPLPPEGLRGRDHTVLVPIRFRLDS